VSHLVDRFGNVAAIFRASLTELEATGLLAVSAQSIGTGKSLEPWQEELEKAKAAGAQIISLDDSRYPVRLREIYDPPVILYLRGDVGVLAQPVIAVVEHVTRRHTVRVWPSDWQSILRRTAW
jgi:DNA processing protein